MFQHFLTSRFFPLQFLFHWPCHFLLPSDRWSQGLPRPIRTSRTTCGPPRSASCSPAPWGRRRGRGSLTMPTGTAPSWATRSPTSQSSSPSSRWAGGRRATGPPRTGTPFLWILVLFLISRHVATFFKEHCVVHARRCVGVSVCLMWPWSGATLM